MQIKSNFSSLTPNLPSSIDINIIVGNSRLKALTCPLTFLSVSLLLLSLSLDHPSNISFSTASQQPPLYHPQPFILTCEILIHLTGISWGSTVILSMSNNGWCPRLRTVNLLQLWVSAGFLLAVPHPLCFSEHIAQSLSGLLFFHDFWETYFSDLPGH